MNSKYCDLHEEPLKEGRAAYFHDSVVYSDMEFLQASLSFPRSKSFQLFGSMMLRSGLPKSVPVIYCPTCRRMERRWLYNRLPSYAGILGLVVEFQEKEEMTIDRLGARARMFLSQEPQIIFDSVEGGYPIQLKFGKENAQENSKAVILPDLKEKQGSFPFQKGQSFFGEITLLNPNQIIRYLQPGSKFHGSYANGDTGVFGELLEVKKVDEDQ